MESVSSSIPTREVSDEANSPSPLQHHSLTSCLWVSMQESIKRKFLLLKLCPLLTFQMPSHTPSPQCIFLQDTSLGSHKYFTQSHTHVLLPLLMPQSKSYVTKCHSKSTAPLAASYVKSRKHAPSSFGRSTPNEEATTGARKSIAPCLPFKEHKIFCADILCNQLTKGYQYPI